MSVWYILAIASFVLGWLVAIVPSTKASWLVRASLSLSFFAFMVSTAVNGLIQSYGTLGLDRSKWPMVSLVGTAFAVAFLFLTIIVLLIKANPKTSRKPKPARTSRRKKADEKLHEDDKSPLTMQDAFNS